MTVTPTRERDKERAVRRKGSSRDRHQFLLRQAARRRQQRNQHQENVAQHCNPIVVLKNGVGADARRRRYVVANALV